MLSHKVATLIAGILIVTTQICGFVLNEGSKRYPDPEEENFIYPTETPREPNIVGSSCKLKSGKHGICTILQQCDSMLRAIIQKKIPLSDVVMCPDVDDAEVICCPENQYAFPPNNASSRKADTVCEQYIAEFRNLPKLVDYHILNGYPTSLGEFPHMAAIGFEVKIAEQTKIHFKCGGSLISNQYVMTAAHCVDHPKFPPAIVRLGTISLNGDPENERDFGVESVILHPNYRNSWRYHDIALIRLNSTVPLTSRTIFPACLNTDTTDIEPDTELIATGWGTTNVTTRTPSDILLKIALTTVTSPTCVLEHKEYGFDRRLPRGILDAQMCAYDTSLKGDTCEGDSGGPLQKTKHEQIANVIGMTSFGLHCGSSLSPVYTRVSFYLDWLEEVVWPNQG